MWPQKFCEWLNSDFVGSWPEMVPTSSQIFQAISNQFLETKFQMKAYYFTFSHREKISKFFFKFLKLSHKNYFFLYQLFLWFFFCENISSISTNKVSNRMSWYLLSILVTKIWKKKINDDENEKNRKGFGFALIIYKF